MCVNTHVCIYAHTAVVCYHNVIEIKTEIIRVGL